MLCAGSCVYNHWDREPIQIGRLQRYATENAIELDPELLKRNKKPPTGMKIACIGGGPASLAAAGHLALDGHSVVVLEQRDLGGGLNTTGVAPYKLMAEDSLREIESILDLGDIELRTGVTVVASNPGSAQITVEQLLADFDAVFIGIGLGPDTLLDVEGAEGPGVVGATAYIERLKLDPELSLDGVEKAIVVGGGNTAIDVARELAQLGIPDVAMVYRRTAKVMSGYAHEMDGARHDGVRLIENRQPSRVLRDGDGAGSSSWSVSRFEQPTARTPSRPWRPISITLAIGQSRLTKLAGAFEGVELDEKGRVVVDEATCRTGNPKVYAGGDCVNGGKEVVNAAQHGKLAARAITASFLG